MSTTPTAPRGIRNNNPGNIRWGSPWQGLVPRDAATDQSFCQFTAPQYGIRAMAKVFTTYATQYGLNTIQGIISRWAPPNENNTPAYVASVAQAVGTDANTPIDVTNPGTMALLIKAVIQHENGMQPYDDATIAQGGALAQN